MRLLVTGGSGFLGEYVLTEATRRGHETVALARSDAAAVAVARRGGQSLSGEHFTKPGVLRTFDDVAAALAPSGTVVGRVPNAVSPLGGHIQVGDFTHNTSFTARSIRQLAAAVGFDSVLARSSPPVAHGLGSAARVMVWQVVSACYRIALAAETGMLRGHIVTQNLVFTARKAALAVKPGEG